MKKYETGFFIMTADDDVVVKLEQVLLRDGIFWRDQIWKVALTLNKMLRKRPKVRLRDYYE